MKVLKYIGSEESLKEKGFESHKMYDGPRIWNKDGLSISIRDGASYQYDVDYSLFNFRIINISYKDLSLSDFVRFDDLIENDTILNLAVDRGAYEFFRKEYLMQYDKKIRKEFNSNELEEVDL